MHSVLIPGVPMHVLDLGKVGIVPLWANHRYRCVWLTFQTSQRKSVVPVSAVETANMEGGRYLILALVGIAILSSAYANPRYAYNEALNIQIIIFLDNFQEYKRG